MVMLCPSSCPRAKSSCTVWPATTSSPRETNCLTTWRAAATPPPSPTPPTVPQTKARRTRRRTDNAVFSWTRKPKSWTERSAVQCSAPSRSTLTGGDHFYKVDFNGLEVFNYTNNMWWFTQKRSFRFPFLLIRLKFCIFFLLTYK